jgi:hypothetical protein
MGQKVGNKNAETFLKRQSRGDIFFGFCWDIFIFVSFEIVFTTLNLGKDRCRHDEKSNYTLLTPGALIVLTNNRFFNFLILF